VSLPNNNNQTETETQPYIMKCYPWTLALLGAGLVSLPSVAKAEEKPSSVLTALGATTISGYVDTSAEWNPGTGHTFLPPYAFSAGKSDGFNLDVVKLTIEHPVDAADAWGAGYKVDLIAGPDANALATQSSHVAGDFGVKQAYVALHAPVGNGLDFKLGVWDTIIGYEVFEAGNNPNFTRSYGYTMEPTTHTGLQATYTFCESFSATVAIANSVGPIINDKPFFHGQAESAKTYMASLNFTAPTNAGVLAGSTLTACVIDGQNPFLVGDGNETSWYLGGTVNTPITGLKAGAAFDYLDVHDSHGETWALGGYLAFQATEKLSLYARAEYLRDRGDQKLFAFRTTDPDTGDVVVTSTAPDKVLALTGTVQYDLWKNVLTRLEVRWDHSLSGQSVWGDPGALVKNEVLLAANVIYKF